jgi:hypothetical protein
MQKLIVINLKVTKKGQVTLEVKTYPKNHTNKISRCRKMRKIQVWTEESKKKKKRIGKPKLEIEYQNWELSECDKE